MFLYSKWMCVSSSSERERHTPDIPIGAAVAGAAVLVDVFLCYLDMAKTAVLNDNRTR